MLSSPAAKLRDVLRWWESSESMGPDKEHFNAFLSRCSKKRERERSLSSDRPRSVYEKGLSSPQKTAPTS